jgi:antitoxin ParD1/3/4
MPTRNVNLTDELDGFVLAKVGSGRYENASEVVRAALRTLEREERRYEAKLAALQSAIDAGDSSGIADGNSFDRVRQALTLPAKPHRRKSVVRRDPQELHRRKSVVRRAPIEER